MSKRGGQGLVNELDEELRDEVSDMLAQGSNGIEISPLTYLYF